MFQQKDYRALLMQQVILLAGKKSGLKYLIPGVSAIPAGLSIAAGDYAGAIIDGADAAADVAMVSGNAAAASIGMVAKVLYPIGIMTGSAYVGELSRGWGDWIAGDGTNVISSLVH